MRDRIQLESHAEVLHEATTMALYVAVVELAELTALPLSGSVHGEVTGPVGLELLAIVWGTAVGLALAHWFAFHIASGLFRGRRPSHLDTRIGLAQLAAAALVATVTSLPVLLLPESLEQQAIGYMPAIVIGVIGYLGARAAEKSRLASFFWGLAVLTLGVAVALAKTLLSGH